MKIFDRGVLQTFAPDAIASAAQVARVIQLEGLRLVEMSAKMGNFTPNRAVLFDIDVETAYSLSNEDTMLIQTAEFQLVVRDEGLRDVVALEVTAKFEMAYKMFVQPPPEEVRDQFLGSFVAINGVFNAWPYLRELAQNTTARMGIPAVLLPVFRITAPPPQPQQHQQPPTAKQPRATKQKTAR